MPFTLSYVSSLAGLAGCHEDGCKAVVCPSFYHMFLLWPVLQAVVNWVVARVSDGVRKGAMLQDNVIPVVETAPAKGQLPKWWVDV